MAPRDGQDHELSGATAEAAQSIDAATRAFILSYGDPIGYLDAAISGSPACAMAWLAKGWINNLSNDPKGIAAAQALLDTARGLPANERERAHAKALDFAIAGRWDEAVAVLDRHLMAYPLDLLAHQVALRLDGFQGRFHLGAGRSARALPQWSTATPGYGMLLSFYGFGLEELGDYARAEDVSRQAAEMEPLGYWPHHAVSHVLEMTGRPADGVRWMQERAPLWSSPKHTNRSHIWWHNALFHVELGEYREALSLYDRDILPALRPTGTSLCNGTALLWRIETFDADVNDRWAALVPLWADRATGDISPFNDIHAAMTYLRTDKRPAFEALLAVMRQSAAGGASLALAYKDVAIPVVEALERYTSGDYAGAVDKLFPVRHDLWRMGGSAAQRDIVDWTLVEAANRAGNRSVALALSNERLASRPQSIPNRRFGNVAAGIAA
ncbi:MAG: tetratricopeptide repeat protein [Hyphomicrobiaceae bacterium]